jgi:hypothetical protein
MDSACRIIAERVVKSLVKEKLLSESEAKKLAPKLANGKVRAEEWRLAVESSIPRKAKP